MAALYSQAAGAYLTRAFSMPPETGATLGYIVIFLAVMVIVAWGGRKSRLFSAPCICVRQSGSAARSLAQRSARCWRR